MKVNVARKLSKLIFNEDDLRETKKKIALINFLIQSLSSSPLIWGQLKTFPVLWRALNNCLLWSSLIKIEPFVAIYALSYFWKIVLSRNNSWFPPVEFYDWRESCVHHHRQSKAVTIREIVSQNNDCPVQENFIKPTEQFWQYSRQLLKTV